MLRSTKYNYEDNIVYGSILFPKGEMGQYICFNGFLFFLYSLFVCSSCWPWTCDLPSSSWVQQACKHVWFKCVSERLEQTQYQTCGLTYTVQGSS